MKAMIIRVGIDTGYGGTLGPIFEDGSFEFVPIPEYYAGNYPVATYQQKRGRRGQPLSMYVPDKLRNTSMHDDPEFETFTYGDPTPKRKSLRKLHAEDLLVFYAGLQPYEHTYSETALYIIGYFKVREVVDFNMISDEVSASYYKQFSNNAHVKRHDSYEDMLVVVGDRERSRLLRKGIRLSQRGRDNAGRPLHVVSEYMEQLLGIKGSIQRSTPRRIGGDEYVKNLTRLLEEAD